MTESLTERLRQRAESQTAENAKIISAELEKLSSGIRRQLNDDLAKIQTDIAGRSLSISEDLNTLSMISRRWMIAGGALILGLVILVGFFATFSTRSVTPFSLRRPASSIASSNSSWATKIGRRFSRLREERKYCADNACQRA